MLLTGDDFPAAIESLARRYGIPLPAPAARPARGGERGERDLEAVARGGADWSSRRSSPHRPAARALPREAAQIPAELVERFGLGYAPDGWRDLLRRLRRQVLGRRTCEAAGLVARPERRRRALRPLPQPADVPHPQRLRPAGRLRRPHAGRRQGQVRQHRRDRALPQGPAALRARTRPSGRSARAAGRVLVEGYFDVLGAVACRDRRGGGEHGHGAHPGAGAPARPLSPRRWWSATTATAPARTPSAGRCRSCSAEGLAVRRARFAGRARPRLAAAGGGRGRRARGGRGGRGRGAARDRAAGAARRRPRTRSGRPRRRRAAPSCSRRSRTRSCATATAGWRPTGWGSRSSCCLAAARQGGASAARARPPGAAPAGRGRGSPRRRRVADRKSGPGRLLLAADHGEPRRPREPAPAGGVSRSRPAGIFSRPFVALYERGAAAAPPTVLGGGSPSWRGRRRVDRMAELLVEVVRFAGDAGALGRSSTSSADRWRQQRLSELASEISEAERHGDSARLETLLAREGSG